MKGLKSAPQSAIAIDRVCWQGEAVAAGVGFLGAGAIIQSGAKVKGLTTAASIWLVSAIGVACGSGFWPIAVLLTVMGLVTLTVIRWLEPAGHSDRTTNRS